MTIDEHRDLARTCREHGYTQIAEYHEKRVKELEKGRKA